METNNGFDKYVPLCYRHHESNSTKCSKSNFASKWRQAGYALYEMRRNTNYVEGRQADAVLGQGGLDCIQCDISNTLADGRTLEEGKEERGGVVGQGR